MSLELLVHHAERVSLQLHFSNDVLSLLEVTGKQGNPILDESYPDLIAVDTREITRPDINDAYITAIKKGRGMVCMTATSETVFEIVRLL